ncbi:MAG: D-alanine--D-alanine ligase [Lachnospiraceae bacterium]|nr:D-alanine--D-alanine ligase [Lachnospiraceae bacterium]MBO4461677.1 D-alanine--D-alanine ligase [Lachnospiraceae bacterium]MBR5789620.1 D-alanine--D-alanine ligase [Lachnospiraceae bacterium]
MNIVVLAGGLSTERDVSLVSAKGIRDALRRRGHKVCLVDVFYGFGKRGDDITGIFDRAESLDHEINAIPTDAPDLEKIKSLREDKSDVFFGPNVIEICRMADIVFIGLHGAQGEDGRVQAAFDLFGIKYTGTDYLSAGIAMDKELTKEFFEREGIPTPKGVVAEKGKKYLDFKETGLTIPCIVKPCCGGSSVGTTIVNSEADYVKALNEAFKYEDRAMVEEFVKGREFSVAVVEGKAYPVIEIAPKEGFYDYKNKYAAGSAVETCPADIPDDIAKKMQEYAARAFKCLRYKTYARMDFLLGENGRIVCLEANTLPGMTPTSLLPQEAAVLGTDYDSLCEYIIKISLDKYKK